MDKRPIGIFDSGLGGLTVLKEIRKVLPNEDMVYLGDTARVPYGTRSKKIIEKFSLQCAYFLAGKGVKCIVVACNTASSNAINILKREIQIPIFDVVNSSIAALREIKDPPKIGVIGTSATINSHAHKTLAKKNGYDIKLEKACPLFVPLVENGEVSGKVAQLISDKYLKNLSNKIDVLIMGCTHYPLLSGVIKKSVGSKVVLIDPAIQLSGSLKTYLDEKNLNSGNKSRVTLYYLTDYSESFIKTYKIFLESRETANIKLVELN